MHVCTCMPLCVCTHVCVHTRTCALQTLNPHEDSSWLEISGWGDFFFSLPPSPGQSEAHRSHAAILPAQARTWLLVPVPGWYTQDPGWQGLGSQTEHSAFGCPEDSHSSVVSGLWGVPSRAPRLCLCPRDAPGLCPGHPRSRQRPAPSAPTLTADDHTRPGRPAQPRPLLSGHLPRPLLPGTSPLTQNRTRSANHHLQRPLVPLRLIVMSPSPHRAHWAPAQAGPWGPGLECPSTALLHPQQPGAGEDPPTGTWATR